MIQFNYNPLKAKAALLLISSRLRGEGIEAGFHKVFKILYGAERSHLVDWGRPIVSDSFIRMKNGPVPSSIYDTAKEVKLTRDNAKHSAVGFRVDGGYRIIPVSEPDTDQLSPSDIGYIETSIEENKHLSHDELTRKYHGLAWKNTLANTGISWELIAKEGGASSEALQHIAENSHAEHLYQCC